MKREIEGIDTTYMVGVCSVIVHVRRCEQEVSRVEVFGFACCFGVREVFAKWGADLLTH